MSTRSGKRSAPSDFDDEPERHNKKPCTDDLEPVFTSEVTTWPPAPAQSPSGLPENDDDHQGPTARSVKRKLEQQQGAASNPLASKRARASNGRWMLPGLRGGSTRRSQVVEDSDDGDDDESKNAPEESSATPTREPAAETSESNEEGESTSSSQKPVKDTDGSGSKDADSSSEPMSSTRKTDDDSSSNNDSSEPTSSSRKTVNGTDSSSDETTESAESSEKGANDSESTSDATSSASETSAGVQTSEEASKKAAKVDTRLKERKARQISGLVNNSNQCFSNSVIQLVDAALDGHELDTVLGPVGSVAPFKSPLLDKDDGFDVPKKRGAKKTGKKPESAMSKVRSKIHEGIDKVRKSGKLRALSPRKHLRALLNRMRQHKNLEASEQVNGYLFQQILAYGDAGASREKLDGRQQQDCYEYYNALLTVIKSSSGEDPEDEESDQRPAIIDSLFNFKTEEASMCSNESCEYKGSVKEGTGNTHTLTAPAKQAKFEDLLEESNVSLLDSPCPKRGEETVARVTEFTDMADNFVVYVNRVDFAKDAKITTAIELPFQPIELGGKDFVLNAIIIHKGPSAQAGHYTIYRKRCRDWETRIHGNSTWYHINDHKVASIAAKDIKDGRKGQSAMLLFKAVY